VSNFQIQNQKKNEFEIEIEFEFEIKILKIKKIKSQFFNFFAIFSLRISKNYILVLVLTTPDRTPVFHLKTLNLNFRDS
jgi:hypothetical protein